MAIPIITAIVSAVSNVVSGINKTASDQYLAKEAEYQSNLDYERSKEMVYYKAYGSQFLIYGLIVALGFAFILIILYQTRKN